MCTVHAVTNFGLHVHAKGSLWTWAIVKSQGPKQTLTDRQMQRVWIGVKIGPIKVPVPKVSSQNYSCSLGNTNVAGATMAKNKQNLNFLFYGKYNCEQNKHQEYMYLAKCILISIWLPQFNIFLNLIFNHISHISAFSHELNWHWVILTGWAAAMPATEL